MDVNSWQMNKKNTQKKIIPMLIVCVCVRSTSYLFTIWWYCINKYAKRLNDSTHEMRIHHTHIHLFDILWYHWIIFFGDFFFLGRFLLLFYWCSCCFVSLLLFFLFVYFCHCSWSIHYTNLIVEIDNRVEWQIHLYWYRIDSIAITPNNGILLNYVFVIHHSQVNRTTAQN